LCGITTSFDPHDAFVGAEEAGSPVPLPALHTAARMLHATQAVPQAAATAALHGGYHSATAPAVAAVAESVGVTATPPPPRAGQAAHRQPVRAVHDLVAPSHPALATVDALPVAHAAAPFFPASARYMAAAARLAVRGQLAPEPPSVPAARSITPGRAAVAAGGARAASMPDLRAESSVPSARSSLSASHSFHEAPVTLALQAGRHPPAAAPLIAPAAPLQMPMAASELHSEHRARPSRPRPAAQPDTITLFPINSARSRSRSPL